MITRRLVTHGCSFTYGEELADPSSSSWPALVAKQLGLDLLNLAKPAYSNDLILEDLVSTDINKESFQDLVIVGWTSHSRIGLKDRNGWFTTRANARDNHGHRSDINKLLITELDADWLRDRWLRQVLLAQSYLQSKHAKYLFLSAFDNLDRLNAKNDLLTKLDSNHFVGWPNQQMVDWVYPHALGPNRHPLDDGHAAIANAVLGKVYELYNLPRRN